MLSMRYKLLLTMRFLVRRFQYYSRRASVTALFVLATLAILAQTSLPAHVHSDGEPGIYNAECPLAAAAATHRAAPMSAASVAGWVRTVAPLLVFTPATSTPDSPFDLAAPRAPPLA
jgi:hypothetical protein